MRAVARGAAIAAAVCGVVLGGASVHGVELTRNGGFEEPDLSAWRFRSLAAERVAASDAPEGAYVLRIAPDPAKGDPQAVARQALPYVTPGARYVFGAALAVSGGAADARLTVEWMDGDDGFGVSVLTNVTPWTTRRDGVFQFLSAQATAPTRARSALVNVEVRGVASGVEVRVDAVTVDGPAPATPTPTSAPTQTPTATPSATATSTTTPTPTATPTPGPGEELRNAGFEEVADGVPVAWQKYGGELSTSSRARSGERAGLLRSATDATKWAYQTVVVEGGAWYEFDAWVLSDDPAVERALLRVSWYASPDGSGAALATVDSTEALERPESGYRHLTTGPAQAPPEARSARPRVLLAPAGAGLASILIDDAGWRRTSPPTATPSPTPASPTATATAPAPTASQTPVRLSSGARPRSEALAATAALVTKTPAGPADVAVRPPAATPRALEPRVAGPTDPGRGAPWWAWTAGAAAAIAAVGVAASAFWLWRRIS
ncbi:MAG TPA: hypothetical protein VNM43_07475 [Dehalococcoidia bacterium]|nr:hypothetical protein [Dehalococcoidia bacterium]